MAPSTPVQTHPQRLLAPDLARGFMLLLIAMAYAGVYVGAPFGVDASGERPLDRIATFGSVLFLDNRAFPMFAILFGYGVAWSVGRRTTRGVPAKETRRGLRRRALYLLLFGAVHAFLVYPGEILTSYGLALLVTGFLLFRSVRATRITLALTGAFYLVAVPLTALLAEVAGREQVSVVAGYAEPTDWLGRLLGLPVTPLFLAIGYPLFFLVPLGYLAGRARLFEKTESRRGLLRPIAWGGLAVSLAGALPSALIITGVLEVGTVAAGLLIGLQILTGVAGGAAYAAFFAIGSRRLASLSRNLTRAVAALGQRSLSFYIFNSVVVALVLHPDLVGLGTRVGAFGGLVVAALSWTLSVALAVWMEDAGRPGPLEQLMRRAIHGHRPLSQAR